MVLVTLSAEWHLEDLPVNGLIGLLRPLKSLVVVGEEGLEVMGCPDCWFDVTCTGGSPHHEGSLTGGVKCYMWCELGCLKSGSSHSVCLHIELGRKRELVHWFVVVLVACDMVDGWVGRECLELGMKGLEYIPVRV